MEDQILSVKKDRSDELVDKLLDEYNIQRTAIKGMITDIENIKDRIDKLIPETLDVRYVRLFEEKVKAITGLFTVLLDMRKEINKTLKDEIELRRRVSQGEEIPIEEMLDVRKFARKVQEFKEAKDKVQAKRFIDIKRTQAEDLKKVTTPEDAYKGVRDE
jgi:hypothetical protein